MKKWFVIYTQPRSEDRALWHLRNQGFRCFLPRCRSTKRHARRTYMVLEPLFPRYMFVRLDPGADSWRSINGTRGVIELITDGFRPLAIADGIVEKLILESDDEGATPLTMLGLFWKGRKVRIKHGPFSGQTADVDAVHPSGGDRVEILLGMLGAKCRLQMPGHALETV